jgi:heme/copper-type cytochrome/quinol oxidase subunit 2
VKRGPGFTCDVDQPFLERFESQTVTFTLIYFFVFVFLLFFWSIFNFEKEKNPKSGAEVIARW